MQRHFRLLILLIFTLGTLDAAAQVRVSGGFVPQRIRLGQIAEYRVQISGSDSAPNLGTLPEVEGLSISSTPSTSQNTTIINGNFSASITYSYAVMAHDTGTYTMPAMEVSIGGQNYSIAAATLTVDEADPIFKDGAYMEIEAPDTLFLGQVAAGKLRLGARTDLQVKATSRLDRQVDGLSVSELEDSMRRDDTVTFSNGTYAEQTFPMRIEAIEPGIKSIRYELNLRMYSGRSNFNKALVAEARINVKPLPPGAPASFNGAVGQFSVLRSSTSTETRVGEPIELLLEIAGSGSIESLQAPQLTQSSLWRAYPPTEEFIPGDELKTSGRKRFRYLLSPTQAGKLQTPEVRFSYLDPATGQYEEKVAQGETITVAPAAPGYIPPSTGNVEAPSEERPQRDPNALHPIALTGSRMGDLLTPIFLKPTFLALNSLPPFLIAAVVFWRVRERRLARHPELRTVSHARRQARAAGRRAVAAAAAGNATTFRDEARHALRQAVVARCPERAPTTITASDILRLLPDGQVDRRAIQQLFLNEPPAADQLPVAKTSLCAALESLGVRR